MAVAPFSSFRNRFSNIAMTTTPLAGNDSANPLRKVNGTGLTENKRVAWRQQSPLARPSERMMHTDVGCGCNTLLRTV